jgi:nitronate monooxygenase
MRQNAATSGLRLFPNMTPMPSLSTCLNLPLKAPLLQAPMAGVQDHRLALAVCRAGGLGALPAAMLSPEQLQHELTQLQQGAEGAPYNVNFFCHVPPSPDAAALQAWQDLLAPYCAESGLAPQALSGGAGRLPFGHAAADVLEAFRPAVLSFHFGLPEPHLLARVKAWGSRVLASATTVAEAVWLQDHGADAIIAQGLEAGGHRGHFLSEDLTLQMGTMALLPRIRAAVRVPVIAAGGIASAQAVRAALALGADAVQVGTAYLCCDQASTSAVHRQALLSPAAAHTALTRLFTGRPARGIVNRIMRELGPMHPAAPAFPLASTAIGPLRAAAEQRGLGDFSPLWSGQNTQGCQAICATALSQQLMQGFSA